MAGKPVDETLQKLLPLLDKGDIVIDGGNSNFHDTNSLKHRPLVYQSKIQRQSIHGF